MPYIPENLDLEQILKNNNKTEFLHPEKYDNILYLIHLTYEQRILYKCKQPYVPLKALYLRKFIRDYKIYRDLLIELKIIDCDLHYILGKKSYGYKLCINYELQKAKLVNFKSDKLVKVIKKWTNNRLPKTVVHKYLFEKLKSIQIQENVFDYINNNINSIELNPSLISINKIQNKDFFMICDDYGRIHTNITNLKSSLRRYLRVNNQKLVNIDLVNSQPLFLYLLLSNILPPSPPPIRCTTALKYRKELDLYKQLTEGGNLYDYLIQNNPLEGVNRKEYKKKFFREILFGKNVSKEFDKVFPLIAGELRKIKKKNYKQIAWSMQRIESKVIITQICGRIKQDAPGIFINTIHDSFLTTEDQLNLIKNIISEEFSKIGLNPTLSVEYY